MRISSVSAFLLMLVLAPAVASSQTPQTYSMTLKMGTLVVQVARDGTKESVEQTVPPSKNGPGMHIRALYDLAAHKLWTMNLEGGPCTVVAYTSPAVPSMFDPISGAEEMRAELAREKPQAIRSEAVNGIPTKVYEVPVPEIKGKMRMFLHDPHGFPVKTLLIMPDGKEQPQFEITRLSFARPPADLFVAPPSCEQLGGQTSATGGHVEMNVGGEARGGQKPAPARPPTAKPAQKPAAAPAPKAAAAAEPEIDIRGAGVSPVHYTGPAPAAYRFSFSIDASGPVEAVWVLVSQADTAWESGKIVFTAAGTKELVVPVKIGVGNGQHWEGAGHLEIVVGAKRYSSAKVPVSADCKAK